MLNYFIIYSVYNIYLVNHLKDSQRFKELSKKIFGGNFSFTIESANKRLIKYELALNKSQLALIDYQITNWKLRLNLFNKLLDFIENQEFIRLSKDELRLKQSIMNMMKKRLEAGIVSQIDLDNTCLLNFLRYVHHPDVYICILIVVCYCCVYICTHVSEYIKIDIVI